MLARIGLSIHAMQATGGLSQHGRLLDSSTLWILSGSILAAGAEARHLKGRLVPLISYACSGIGIVGSYHRNTGNWHTMSTRKALTVQIDGSFG
jgi:hypothetical protein